MPNKHCMKFCLHRLRGGTQGTWAGWRTSILGKVAPFPSPKMFPFCWPSLPHFTALQMRSPLEIPQIWPQITSCDDMCKGWRYFSQCRGTSGWRAGLHSSWSSAHGFCRLFSSLVGCGHNYCSWPCFSAPFLFERWCLGKRFFARYISSRV